MSDATHSSVTWEPNAWVAELNGCRMTVAQSDGEWDWYVVRRSDGLVVKGTGVSEAHARRKAEMTAERNAAIGHM